MIMQDAKDGAGMFKCLSCEKPITLHRPGIRPDTVQGTDGSLYRAGKESADTERYSPRWASSQTPGSSSGRQSSPPKGVKSASPPRRQSISGPEKPPDSRPSSATKPKTRPSSAKVRATVA
eukprot:CAMPEP_0184298980 /NCGR_PEP_ID=MMETSP1049-20130417/9691_1 /TAXON_ID=77928 /ORGANISM="Proteomonas sulcata, Strain CCMP704" /LENGTH=120 /DNA_ID=CAMNT_0026609281 /DNA_START=147 /DNA_END=509 /DNA_ORIENTATION=+